MDAATIVAIIGSVVAVASIILSAVVATWKISQAIGGIETRLTEKFNTQFNALNGEVQHIKGLLEGLSLSDKLDKNP